MIRKIDWELLVVLFTPIISAIGVIGLCAYLGSQPYILAEDYRGGELIINACSEEDARSLVPEGYQLIRRFETQYTYERIER